MGVGWRRAFCTSIRGDPPDTAAMIPTAAGEKEQNRSPSPSPRSCAKLSFFSAGSARGSRSTPSTPRLLLPSSSTAAAAAAEAGIPNPNNLRCRTKSKSPDSPGLLLQCDADGTPVATPASSTATTPTAGAAAAAAAAGASAVPANRTTPRRIPALFQRRAFSTPSSPRSPSAFGLLKHFTRSRCRICSRSLKASQEMPVFTAECSHAFHFPCIAGHVRTNGSLACPVCSAAWSQAPLLSAVLRHSPQPHGDEATAKGGETENRNPNRRSGSRQSIKCHAGGRDLATESKTGAACPKVYDDDEPLLSLAKGGHVGGAGVAGMRFNPIPEAAEEDKDDDDYEDADADFKDGIISIPSGASKSSSSRTNGLHLSIMPQAALVTTGRRHHNFVVALKVKAPSIKSSTPLLHPAHRAPIDLVTVLDVSHGMTGEKLHMLKRAMRLVISSLGSMDRLSIVAFSAVAGAKRLLALRRMSRQGQRSARQIVERLVVGGGAVAQGGKGTSIGDALRKATKVLEDRRERNPVATIMLLSDTGQQQQQEEDPHGARKEYTNHHDQSLHSPRLQAHGGDLRPSPSPKAANATTRFAHLEIPVGSAPPPPPQQQHHHHRPALYEDTFAKCVGGLVSVVMQDVHLQLTFSSGEISAVYLCGGGGAGLCVGGNSIRLGDMYAEEERELLLELRVPAAGSHHDGHHQLSVKCNYMDPAAQQLVLGEEQPLLLPPLVHSGSYSTASLQLRNLFVSTRALTESRRLVDLHDYATAQHLLSSARSLLLQSAASGGSSDQDNQLVRGLEAELADLQRRRLQLRQQQQQRGQYEEYLSPSLHRLSRREAPAGEQPLTPTSAWRAAEQLAKVAIMRKSLNRVSDLHGFENARF